MASKAVTNVSPNASHDDVLRLIKQEFEKVFTGHPDYQFLQDNGEGMAMYKNPGDAFNSHQSIKNLVNLLPPEQRPRVNQGWEDTVNSNLTQPGKMATGGPLEELINKLTGYKNVR